MGITARWQVWWALVAAGAGCVFDPSASGVATGDAAAPVADAAAPGVIDAAAPAPDGSPLLPDAAPPEPTGYYKILTIDGALVAGSLADFPIYVELDGDADLTAHASSSGADVFFTDATGANVLDYELQHWDRSAGRLQAWVRMPSLDAGDDAELQLHYGDTSTTAAPDPAGVWQNGFVAVWHLEQAPDGPASVEDSLGARDATGSTGMNAGNLTSAVLGNGLEFDGITDELTFTNPLAGATAHTISAWVEQDPSTNNDALVVLGNGVCGQARWLHSRFTGGPVAVGFYCDDFTATSTDIQGEGPTLLHWTFDGADSRLYRDGDLAAGPFTHADAPSTTGGVGRIGNAPAAFGTAMGLHGVVDEVRIATVERSAAWVATEHANQSAPAAFISVGPEQPRF